jgi:hypothetical protein
MLDTTTSTLSTATAAATSASSSSSSSSSSSTTTAVAAAAAAAAAAASTPTALLSSSINAPAVGKVASTDEEKFHPIRVAAGETFKTVRITPTSTTSESVDLLLRKLCQGMATDEKLMQARMTYSGYWLYFKVGEDSEPLNADAIIWPLRFGDFVWQSRSSAMASSKSTKRASAQSSSTAATAVQQRKKDRTDRERKADPAAPKPRKELTVKIVMSDGNKPSITLQPSTTCAEVIELIIQKLAKGKTDEALASTKEQYRDFWLFASLGMNTLSWSRACTEMPVDSIAD